MVDNANIVTINTEWLISMYPSPGGVPYDKLNYHTA